MFFDFILLRPQNKAQFGNAWLAATRGIRFLKEAQIKDTDIVKLWYVYYYYYLYRYMDILHKLI